MDEDIADIEAFGEGTRWECVRADGRDPRGWLAGAPLCPLFRVHHIAHAGRMWARRPFAVVRAESSGTFALAGLEGEGETLVDGDWRSVREGELCLLPAFAPTGIRAKGEGVWHFAWVRYEEKRELSPIVSADSPVIREAPVGALGHAFAGLIAGLIAESGDEKADPAAVHHWVELIHGFVARAARPWQGDDRLWRVWRAVEANPARDWRLADLAAIAHLSEEHLRRLSQQQLGRSPVQQVTHLRMRRAVSLLAATDDKIETVALAVGYENPFTFSNAFKRWTGRRPSDYREKRH